jgi:hypothetical protein
MPFVDQLTYFGLIDRLLIDLDNAYRCCHPIEHTTKGIFSLNCCDFGRTGRPTRSELARQIFAASVAQTNVA